MSELSLISPTIGLTAIDRFEAEEVANRAEASSYVPIGGKVFESVRSLYDAATTKDRALDMTVPLMLDTDLLQPQRFEAALLIAFEKAEEHFQDDPAAAAAARTHLLALKAAWEQCRNNIAALNQV